jgi:HSP20 family protein
VEPDDVDLTVEKNELSVTVERRWDDSDTTVIASERPQGTFTRQLMLGDTLDLDRLEADLDQGVLTVTIPVAEKSKQRKINVGGGSRGAEAIDASSKEAGDGEKNEDGKTDS